MKKKGKWKKRQVVDLLNAVKSKQRSDEIAEHGKPLSYFHIAKSKKVYSTKKKHKKKIEE